MCVQVLRQPLRRSDYSSNSSMFSWWYSLEAVSRISTISNFAIAILGIWVFLIGWRASRLEAVDADAKARERDNAITEVRAEAANAVHAAKGAHAGAQRATVITARAHVRINNAVLYDPAIHGGFSVHKASLEGVNTNVPRTPLFFCDSDKVQSWKSAGAVPDPETSHNIVFHEGKVSDSAAAMTVDEIVSQCDAMILRLDFLLHRRGLDTQILGGSVTVTFNATVTKTLSIPAQMFGEDSHWTVFAH